MNVLAIGCHPDDVEIACAGTLAKCVKRGDRVVVCHASSGDLGHVIIPPEELRVIRANEAKSAGALAGIEVIYGGFDDLMIFDNGKLARDKLVDVIRSAMPPAALREKQHPAKRSFQAIRIAVNDELGSVEKVMRDALSVLNPGGRLAVITFHSLEDRIVKLAMAEAAKGCTCPPSFPVCVCGKKPLVKLISRKPIVASDIELEENPRSRSAKLRVCEKL